MASAAHSQEWLRYKGAAVLRPYKEAT